VVEHSDPAGPALPIPALPIVDAHVHLYDSTASRHAFLEQKDDMFQALVGDYSALPRQYPLDAYRRESQSCEVKGIICHEFLAQDPVAEMRWMERQADASPIPLAIVALVDFLDPRLEERLETYRALPHVTAVREHLGWDAGNPRRRFATRADLLADTVWRRGLARAGSRGFRCGLEVFGPQLPDLLEVVRLHPGIGFTVAVFGWPLDLTRAGFDRWRADLAELSRCENTRLSISAVETVFGMNWTLNQVRPWLLEAIALFGPGRCMFGSHLPISNLSGGFEPTYAAYRQIAAGFSAGERDLMFRGVAAEWFRVR